MAKKKKGRINVVYSTDRDFEYKHEEDTIQETLPPQQQVLKVLLDRKGRAGKTVTLIKGFRGSEDDLKMLGKKLKTQCGTGGAIKDGDILIQGNFRDKVIGFLLQQGYHAIKTGE